MEKPFAITLNLGSSLANHTGSWRTEKPLYVDLLPPCNQGCPAGENIQQWLFHAEEGNYEAAWRQLTQDNPFPAIMGRVCYPPCETACNRAQVDEAVGINAVERFLGDQALELGWAFEPPAAELLTGKRVLVIGAGPSGLSAAYHLRRLGHEVTVRDAGPMAGGMMRFGIPSYRLPRPILDAEVKRITDIGVSIELNAKVTDLEAALAEGFEAVFLAVGAHIGKRAYIPAGESAKILDAVTYLHDVETEEEKPMLGRKVVVYGGGNTAIDAARTAKRLGAEEAIIVYRRNRDKMPAHDFEVEEALEEGIMLKWLSTIKHVDEGKMLVEKMALDESGFPQPTGEFEELEADSLILALGQEADLSFLEGVEGIAVEDGVVAVGHGKKAARYIDGYLRGTAYTPPAKHAVATFEKLTTWYYADAPHQHREHLEGARRASTFDEVVTGLDEETAQFEARRCMSCGNCFACDNCFGVCPDNAVKKVDFAKGYAIDYDYCKGCGLCVAECPCGSITMVPED